MSETQQPISLLVREAAKTEASFLRTMADVLDEEAPERLEEFFAKLNIPRSAKADDTLEEDGTLGDVKIHVTTFEQEMHITEGIQKFLDRHMRKLRWHVLHPSLEGIANCLRLYRAMAAVTELRIRRVIALLHTKDSLTVDEWGHARELLNRSYREIHEATKIVAAQWVEALLATQAEHVEEVKEALADFPGMVSQLVETLKDLREQVEERRLQMEVRPEGYPPVRPPRYFGGDLMDKSSWRYFWGDISGLADHLRNLLESAGAQS